METDNYFVINKETEKLNIYTTKQFYKSLESDKQKVFKKYCLWSSRQECWVSKAKVANCVYLKAMLLEIGFVQGDAIGERLPFEEQVRIEKQKASMRAERAEIRAQKAKKRSDSLYNTASDMASVIPMGQPILIGHHSEKRDRNYRERIHNTMGKSIREQQKADYYKEKVEIAERTAKGTKYKNPRYLTNRIKECLAAIRRLERYLKGKIYMHSPERPISEKERTLYTEHIVRVQDKLEFFVQCMKKINPDYELPKSSQKAGSKIRK